MSKTEYHQIKFENAAFKSRGIMQTVRMGDKWESVKIGDILEWSTGEGMDLEVKHFRIIGLLKGFVMHDIPSQILQLSHDPAVRTRDGLRQALIKYYPQPTVPISGYEDWNVTVIIFREKPLAPKKNGRGFNSS